MKLVITSVAFVLIAVLNSCTKEKTDDTLERCATVFTQPSWAKNFKADSLYNITAIPRVSFQRRMPGDILWDTSYTASVPIRFLSNGTGEINGNISFQYRLSLTTDYPVLTLTNIQNLSTIYTFPNSFLNRTSISMRIEDFSNAGGTLIFNNGVSYYSSNETYEQSHLSIAR